MSAFILLIVALAASALFAGAETAYYGMNPLRLRHRAKSSKNATLLQSVVKSPEGFLATLLIGNNIANDIVIQMGVALLVGMGVTHPEAWVPLCLTPLVFLFGEAWPKQWMMASPLPRLLLTTPLLALARTILWPIAFPIALLASLLTKGEPSSWVGRRHFAALLRQGAASDLGEASALGAAARALETPGKGVRNFLRKDLVMLPPDLSLDAAQQHLSQTQDGLALIQREGQPPLLLEASRLVHAAAGASPSQLARSMPVLTGDLDLAAILVFLQDAGTSRTWVVEPGQWEGLFDLEHALDFLLEPPDARTL
ncbi:MAG: DUF21 domain-containing protein [Planctomycetes bacterium]|nr:DUF21 domain-containing protein [Planctomycetota bacterium]MBT4028822.1 DUF21 domain-containing protein [Planctomycetota bacterium]MBT4559618.1 DUF21 domain-containing protein [Planctomycetota bacterium]MBT5100556.1 DUF21 domain-containing protein [Planctomycetota bacterium]MBT5119125.1 DUF21 domain-containing protein [Planctomycetota bacterium]